MEWSQACDALVAEYGLLGKIMSVFSEDELQQPSGCAGWNNADLIFHMLLDAQRALVTFNSPVDGPADRDFTNYWKNYVASDESSRAHAKFVRKSTAAHPDVKWMPRRWKETAAAAVRNARSTADIEFVTTQGLVLTMADFIATIVVEATVHHLDLIRNLDGKPGPDATALAVTTATLDGLLPVARPSDWDDVTYILKATGREELSAGDQDSLGEAVRAVPVFS